jgi:di/tricarboxylate transporter
MLSSQSASPGLGMFEIARLGVPSLLLGSAYLFLIGRWLLPDRGAPLSPLDDPREYSVEMIVEPGSPVDGQTIEEAGLRHLPGLFLAEIVRQDQVLPAVSPYERLAEGDRLLFVGVVSSVVDLQKIRGLKPATDQVFKLDSPRSKRCLIEAVVSNSCRLLGMTIRDGRFRSVYNAAIIAVARNGARIRMKVGDIILHPGDTLLLEAHESFVEQHGNSRDFFLVSRVENSNPPRHERAVLAVVIMATMVAVVAIGWLSMLQGAMLAAGMMLIMRCCAGMTARRSVDWQVLLTIAASVGLGRALQVTGVADVLAAKLIGIAGEHPRATLAAVYLVTMLLTEMITNNAAAVLVFPIAMATAQTLEVNHMPFVVAIMMAASASFSTPIGYQTNLMVYNAGGYRFTDFMKVGIPLNLLMWATTVTLAPYFWPF